MKRSILFIVLILIVGFWWYSSQSSKITVSDFDSCVLAGNPVMESYPARCSADGQTYTQDIGNELEKSGLIVVDIPRPNSVVSDPIAIEGKARGNWFFEASFPAKLFDADGRELGSAIVTADGEWMTTEFVPFSATLTFTVPTTTTGKLIFYKDNPSGLPQNDDELVVPVRFE